MATGKLPVSNSPCSEYMDTLSSYCAFLAYITTLQHEYLLNKDSERMDLVAQGVLLGAVVPQPPALSIGGNRAQSHIP